MLLNINKLDILRKTALVVYSGECVCMCVSVPPHSQETQARQRRRRKHRCVFGVIELHANDNKEFMRVCVRQKTPDSEKAERGETDILFTSILPSLGLQQTLPNKTNQA